MNKINNDTMPVHCTPWASVWLVGRRRLQRLSRLALLLSLLVGTLPAGAIVIRHDRADSDYVVDAGHYPQFFHLQQRGQRKVCLASLISEHWAITAGHCTDDTPLRERLEAGSSWPVQVAGQQREVVQLVLHPEYQNGDQLQGVDLALLRLDQPVADVVPLRLNRAADEVQQVVSFIGWGYTGTGVSGRRVNDGKMRLAHNTVIDAGQWLLFHFDDPRDSYTRALPLEGIPGLGDSGGPAFLYDGQEALLIGVAVGEMELEGVPGPQGLYGSVEVYERISLHLEWIDTVLTPLAVTP